MPKGPKPKPPIERFSKKYVVSDTIFYNGTPCWIWTGVKMPRGYGQFGPGGTVTGAKMVLAHRWSYRNTSCVNPTHLEPVTQRENLMRGESFSAVNAIKTHCPKGHEYTPENTAIWKNERKCKICSRERDRRRRPSKATLAALASAPGSGGASGPGPFPED